MTRQGKQRPWVAEMTVRTQTARNLPGGSIEALRLRGEENFRRIGLPSRKEESWRFTPLDRLGEIDGGDIGVTSPDIGDFILRDAYRLVFVNGRLDRNLSDFDCLPAGCRIIPVEEILRGESKDLEVQIATILPPEAGPFEALSASRFDHGAIITLSEGLRIDRPIHLLHLCDADDAALYPRQLISLAAGASATIVEHYVSTAPGFRLPLCEIDLSDGAELRLIRVQDEDEGARHLGIVGASLQSRARLELTSLGIGGGLFRLELRSTLRGEGAAVSIAGLGVASGKEHREHVVRVEHLAPDCRSHQLFRNILDDSSRGVFTGRIVVAPGARQTDADQSSKSLLLSDHAVALNNPQLEIDTDDLRCTHGSTVGELDEEALFYLRARGIGLAEAKGLLTMAFAAEVLGRIPSLALRQELEEQLMNRLRGVVVG